MYGTSSGYCGTEVTKSGSGLLFKRITKIWYLNILLLFLALLLKFRQTFIFNIFNIYTASSIYMYLNQLNIDLLSYSITLDKIVSFYLQLHYRKCLGQFGTDHRGSHACQRRQLRSGRGGELKAVDVYVPLSLNCGICGFWSQLSGATVRSIATSVENASCDYNYCYGVNVQGSLSCRLHGARIHHPSVEQK